MNRQLARSAKGYALVLGQLYQEREIWGKGVAIARGARHLTLGVRLNNPLHLDKALKLAEPLALACKVQAVIARRGQDAPGLVVYQFQLQRRWWETYTRANVTGSGLGLAEEGRQVDYTFDRPHTLIAGATGSGKSETIKSALAALFTTLTPDALGAVLVDPHRDLDAFQNAAHLAAPVDANGIDALTYAVGELEQRKDQNIRDGRRLLVVIDEAEEALGENPQALALATRIAKGGRKFRLNLMLGSQAPKEKTLPGGLLAMMTSRFVGLVDNAQSSANLTGQAGLEAHKLTGAGDFYQVAGSCVERLQVALATDADLGKIPRVVDVPVPEPQIDPAELPEVMQEKRGPGRPSIQVEPRKVASYLHVGPDRISARQAQETLDLSMRGHRLHRNFAREIDAGLEWLEQQDLEAVG